MERKHSTRCKYSVQRITHGWNVVETETGVIVRGPFDAAELANYHADKLNRSVRLANGIVGKN